MGSALRDTAKAIWNGLVDFADFAGHAANMSMGGTPYDYQSPYGLYRASYDTPAFGTSIELMAGIGAFRLSGETGGAEADGVVPRTGPQGLDPDHHNANVTIRDADGNIILHNRVVSGNMTPAEQALGFPRNTLASHTEARAVTSHQLSKGQDMTITGELPPCPSCKGYMNRAARDTGASIQYQWRANGQTQTWTAGGK